MLHIKCFYISVTELFITRHLFEPLCCLFYIIRTSYKYCTITAMCSTFCQIVKIFNKFTHTFTYIIYARSYKRKSINYAILLYFILFIYLLLLLNLFIFLFFVFF